jgi:hypothetical protein
MIYDFNTASKKNDWRIVNDVVMGGESRSFFEIDNEGHGLFTGDVSIENNGGFASIRYRFDELNTENKSKISLRIKGDSKTYQLRIKSNKNDSYSYIHSFQTTDKWETIEIKLSKMYPSFRGQKLSMNNFDEASIEEVSILIGNKKNESFKLLIDKIELK